MRILMATSALALIAGLGAAPALAQGQQNQGQQNQDKQINAAACDTSWQAVDRNSDSKVSSEEARQASDLEFQRLDADKDGFVDAAEFANCRAADMASLSAGGGKAGDGGARTPAQPGAQPDRTREGSSAGDADQAAADTAGGPEPQIPREKVQRAQKSIPGQLTIEGRVGVEDQGGAEQRAGTQEQGNDRSATDSATDSGLRPDIAQADGDGDKKVTRDEFLAGVRQHYQQNRQQFEGLSEEQHARAAAFWFDRFDSNDSGDIDSQELASAERLSEGGLDQADRDGDHMLSQEEWTALEKSGGTGSSAPTRAAAPATGAQEKEGFDALDLDNDGKLSPTEWMTGDLRRRADLAFFAIDADHDGKIGKEEWRARSEAGFKQAQAGGPEAGGGEGPTLYRYYLFVH